MPATPRATFTEHQKYMILVRQSFRCKGVPNYTCPLQGRHFDEAGYDIDHIQPLFLGGSNDPCNLQALCPSCHRVKTIAEQRARPAATATTATATATASNSGSSASVVSASTSVSSTTSTAREAEDRCAVKLIQDFCKNTILILTGEGIQTRTGERVGMKSFYEKFKVWFGKNQANYSKYPCSQQVARSDIIIRKNVKALLQKLETA